MYHFQFLIFAKYNLQMICSKIYKRKITKYGTRAHPAVFEFLVLIVAKISCLMIFPYVFLLISPYILYLIRPSMTNWVYWFCISVFCVVFQARINISVWFVATTFLQLELRRPSKTILSYSWYWFLKIKNKIKKKIKSKCPLKKKSKKIKIKSNKSPN